ncbi:hypothetical protein [uncultured Maritimibacter sp.]|jgi:type IV pilus biogenesis protein PilP|uniref:hypothetical protein n=1 Tax=uncultured Maritimibacter sp. TaxID=991866 RepID=UPI000A63A9E4|nr:hypothetical protein [uncultured Maritimibacter sp.]
MKPNCALDLSHDGIRLLIRDSSGWKSLGEVALDDPDMMNHLADLRQVAEAAVGTISSKLVIPNSQILYTTLDTPGADDAEREVQIRSGLEGLTPYDVRDLVFDWRIEGQTARVAVLARETMDEAEGFADQFGFNPVSFVARPETGTFSGEPFFGQTRAASRILSGARVQPDAAPVPRNPKPYVAASESATGTPTPQAKAQSEPSARSTTLDPFPSLPAEEPAPTKESAEKPANAPDPVPGPPPVRAGVAEAGLPREDDVPAASDRLTWRRPDTASASDATSNTADDTDQGTAPDRTPPRDVEAASISTSEAAEADSLPEAKPAAEAPAKPAARRDPAARRATPSVAPPTLSPFPPTADERLAAGPPLRAPSKPAVGTTPPLRNTSGPKAPVPVSGTAPTSTRDGAPNTPSGPSNGADETPAPSFASRRGAPAAETPTTDATPTASAVSAPPSQSEAPEPEAKTAPAPKQVIDDLAPLPRLSGEAEQRRLAMARALSHTPGEALEPEKKGWFNRKPKEATAKSASEAQAAKPASPATDAPPAKRVLPGVIAPLPEDFAKKPEPQPEPEPKPSRFARKAKKQDPNTEARTKEAEAMTVFGARKSAPTRGKPRYMGLILTLILVLLMAIAAIWSTLTSDDEVALFNPDPADTPVAASPEDSAEPVTDVPSPDQPEDAPTAPPTDTAAVLSPEAAEARYAATGVWQRAPDPLTGPTTTPSEDVYIASIDPAISGADALSLPEAASSEAPPPVTSAPPPPPGTTFDLGDDGLVVPTPEGAVTPTGAFVVQGRPPVVPPARPEGLVTELPQDDAALDPATTADPTPGLADVRPRTRPENLAELNERAQLGGQTLAELAQSRPRARPENLDTTLPTALADAETAATIDATVQLAAADAAVELAAADTAVELTNATDLAVAQSVRPGARPANFQDLVARAAAVAAAPPDTRQAAVENAPSAQDPADDGEPEVIAAAAPSNIPTSASVARSATMKNALNLRQVNVIGIYGSNSSRRALVRMSNGRYVKVAVGDRLDGGRVTSISASRVIYQKGNRQFALDVLPLG